MNRDTLLTIRRNDPNGGMFEPTDETIRAFYKWIVDTFGEETFHDYMSNWDTVNSWV